MRGRNRGEEERKDLIGGRGRGREVKVGLVKGL